MERILDNNYYDLFVNNVLIPQHQKDSDITYLNEKLSLEHVPAESMNPVIWGCILTTVFRHFTL